MKFTILSTVLSLGILAGCSHMHDTKRIPASADQKGPCGLEGSVDERIADCSAQEDSTKEGFVLVTRSRDFKEVHKDVRSGLLWSDKLPSIMGHARAKSACQSNLPEVGGITSKSWRLPTIEEYETASSNGIRAALPNMHYLFWSSSMRRHHYTRSALYFNGRSGVAGYGVVNVSALTHNSVRCVASM